MINMGFKNFLFIFYLFILTGTSWGQTTDEGHPLRINLRRTLNKNKMIKFIKIGEPLHFAIRLRGESKTLIKKISINGKQIPLGTANGSYFEETLELFGPEAWLDLIAVTKNGTIYKERAMVQLHMEGDFPDAKLFRNTNQSDRIPNLLLYFNLPPLARVEGEMDSSRWELYSEKTIIKKRNDKNHFFYFYIPLLGKESYADLIAVPIGDEDPKEERIIIHSYESKEPFKLHLKRRETSFQRKRLKSESSIGHRFINYQQDLTTKQNQNEIYLLASVDYRINPQTSVFLDNTLTLIPLSRTRDDTLTRFYHGDYLLNYNLPFEGSLWSTNYRMGGFYYAVFGDQQKFIHRDVYGPVVSIGFEKNRGDISAYKFDFKYALSLGTSNNFGKDDYTVGGKFSWKKKVSFNGMFTCGLEGFRTTLTKSTVKTQMHSVGGFVGFIW